MGNFFLLLLLLFKMMKTGTEGGGKREERALLGFSFGCLTKLTQKCWLVAKSPSW